MIQTGYALVSVDGNELLQFAAFPAFVSLVNGDIVHGAAEGEVLPDGSRVLPVMRLDESPGKWHKRLRETRQVLADKVLVTVEYSELPDIEVERSQMVCSPLQGRLALAAANLLSQVEGVLAKETTAVETKIAWEYATEWRRRSALIASLAVELNLSDEQVDDLFRSAMSITV